MGRSAYFLPVALLWEPIFAAAKPTIGTPSFVRTSATCASIEFAYHGGEPPNRMYAFAKRPGDADFVEWGRPLPARHVQPEHFWSPQGIYRVLMRDIPPGDRIEVMFSDTPGLGGVVSPPTEATKVKGTKVLPVAPSGLQIHRTDPRLNHKLHDKSVCVDLHWVHPHSKLHQRPADVFFRIKYNWQQEPPVLFCEDEVGELKRSCGVALDLVTSVLPASYATICGLRPNRTITFHVEAFNCDLATAMGELVAVTPPSSPNVVMGIQSKPWNDEESTAGFRPTAVLDWIPEFNPLVVGHAVYLGLKGLGAIKLLCFIPVTARGNLEVPIERKNHTYSGDTSLLADFMQGYAVHQEQELVVSTRTAVIADGVDQGTEVESPGSYHSLGSWLVVTEALKCLTSFEDRHPEYVSHRVTPAWTQEEALTMYD